jgi:hypothetical protein
MNKSQGLVWLEGLGKFKNSPYRLSTQLEALIPEIWLKTVPFFTYTGKVTGSNLA